jgi:hypothetical protein
MFDMNRWICGFMAAGAVAAITALSVQPAAALVILDEWDLNVATINDEGVFNNFTSKLDIDHINVVGSETVILQDVSGGSALGEAFIESGILQWTTTSPEGGGAATGFGLSLVENAVVAGVDQAATIYVQFVGLTGILELDGSITFDQFSGTIKLFADSDFDLDPTTGTVQELAEFQIIDPSGGSDLDFFGGAGLNATVDITLELLSVIDADLFVDKDGNNLDELTLTFHLVNVDSLLDPNVVPNPDNSGVVNGEGVSLIFVQNNGQWNLAEIPEPSTTALLGFGLIALAFFTNRRRRRGAHEAIA